MEVTNVSVKLAPQSGDRLKAFATMALDGEFVVRDLKIIEGTSGLFVAMPSRKLTDHCPKCGGKNHLRAKYCNDCGGRLPEERVSDEDVTGKLHADVAHPINSDCRNRLQGAVLEAYEEELRRSGRGEAGGEAPAYASEEGGEAPAYAAEEAAQGEQAEAEVEPIGEGAETEAEVEPIGEGAETEAEVEPIGEGAETEAEVEPIGEGAETEPDETEVEPLPEPGAAEEGPPADEPVEGPERQEQPRSTFGEGIL